MDARTITNVMRDGDVVTLTLSDGAQFHPGGYPAEGDTGNKSYIVALRDPSSPTGELLPDGPALTYDAALLFRGAGIEDAEVLETIAKGKTIPDGGSESAKAPTVEAPAAAPAAPAQPEGVPMTDQSADEDPKSEPIADNHVAVHESVLQRILDLAERLAKGAAEDVEDIGAEIVNHVKAVL